MTPLPHSLDRTVVIRAPRDVVFRFFTDSERFARWWGPGSAIDARVGGEVRIAYPNGVIARGTVEALRSDESITFSYGYEAPQKPIPVGGSVVTITLQDHAQGTLLQLHHALPTAAARDQHVPGWRFQLAVFANVVAGEQHAGLVAKVDRWFAAWSEADPAARTAMLEECASDDVRMQDQWSCLHGRSELATHIGICLAMAQGTRMQRAGEPRHCQGTALIDWTASDAAGNPRGKGTNVVELAPDGRIAAVVGFW